MWETLSVPWQACMDEAWSAYRAGSRPIGAVITDAAGQIVARGRNRIEETSGDPRTIFDHPLAHAEMNALLAFDDRVHDRYTCALYATTEPCPLCFGAFYMSGLRVLQYGAREGWAGSTNLFGTTPYLSRKSIRIHGPETVLGLGSIVTALATEDTLRTRDPTTESALIPVWRAIDPEGVTLGEALVASGDLQQWKDADWPASAVVNAIAAMRTGLAQHGQETVP